MSCDPDLRQETTMPKYTHKIHAYTQISFFSALSWQGVMPEHNPYQRAVSQVSRTSTSTKRSERVNKEWRKRGNTMTDIYLSKKLMLMETATVKTSTLGDMFDKSRVGWCLCGGIKRGGREIQTKTDYKCPPVGFGSGEARSASTHTLSFCRQGQKGFQINVCSTIRSQTANSCRKRLDEIIATLGCKWDTHTHKQKHLLYPQCRCFHPSQTNTASVKTLHRFSTETDIWKLHR